MNDTKLGLSDAAVVLRKMRVLKGFSRKQSGIIFHLSHKTNDSQTRWVKSLKIEEISN